MAVCAPGPLNETYYEHAYIARYLGIMLLEGEDLTVSDGRLMVRTVSGLKPVSVLWRRLDAAFADPLELNPQSQIGTPGLAEAMRHGAVSLVNALGSGILETRALLAFLPRVCARAARRGTAAAQHRHLVVRAGEERRHVIDNIDRMMIGPALSTRLPFEDEPRPCSAPRSSRRRGGARRAARPRTAPHFVGQEAVTLSTTPVYVDGRLEPRPASLRVYLARTAEGWTVMPGGFARVGLAARHHRARHAARRPGGRRLGGQRQAGRASRRCCRSERDRFHPHACRAACPAARPKT